jgi:hypothetical protein
VKRCVKNGHAGDFAAFIPLAATAEGLTARLAPGNDWALFIHEPSHPKRTSENFMIDHDRL